MTVRVEVNPSLLEWASERSRVDPDYLATRFPLREWQRGERTPTLKQLEDFARATHTPLGMLFLAEPPEEAMPLPDFRTRRDLEVSQPSPDLLDTIYICQQRQRWYRDFAIAQGHERLEFIATLDATADVFRAAQEIRSTLVFGLEERRQFPSWTEALSGLAEHAEDIGVLVMVNGVVGSNTHRRLDPEEFRGFALVDDMAPVVFVNGADTKAGQIFTLAHELVHLWLGRAGVDDPAPNERTDNTIERWCNEVAAEFLVPLRSLQEELNRDVDLAEETQRLARLYKVSTLVALRRIYDTGYLEWDQFRDAYLNELERLPQASSGQGGNFYKTTPVRASKRFTRAIIRDTLEGGTSYRDALRLLGFRKAEAFEELAERMGVA